MNFTDNNVTFKDIFNAGLITGGPKIAKGKYKKDSNNNITGNMPVVNAIDIDWLKAEVPGISDPITSTGQLLAIIGQVKQAIGNISTAPNQTILDRLTILEDAVRNIQENGTGGDDIPSDLVEQLTTLNNQVSSLQTADQNILSRLTTVENKVNNQSSSQNQSIIQQITELMNQVEALDKTKHRIMEKDAYDSLTSYDPDTLYFIIGEPDYIIVNGGSGGSGGGSSTRIDLDSISTQLTINGQLHRENNITLEPGKTYIISGTLAGNITIDASSYTASQMEIIGNTEIILSDVIIVSDETPYAIQYKTPVENKGFKDLIVTVSKNTVNIICCRVEIPIAEDQWGALHSMNNLVVRGSGYLSLRNDGGHGIRATEVDIAGPHIYCTVEHDAIHGKKLFWDYGTLYITKANDGLGTGVNGRIVVLGGTFNTNNIKGTLFDSKQTGLYNPNISMTGITTMEGMLELTPQNFASALNVGYPGYVYKWPTKIDYSAGTNGEQVPLTNNVYKVSGNSHPIVSVVGAIANPIEIVTSGGVDAVVYLNNAFVATNTNAPSIYYNPSDKTGKVKIFNVQDSLNIVKNIYTENTFGQPVNYECDAIKSENNINVEVKNGSHMYVSSAFADGIDGGTMKITDSKGTLVVTHCGQRGLKGNVVVIGPNCEVTQSHITSYYKDPEDIDNYTTFDGICVVKDNCQHTEVGPAQSGNNVKNTGFADIYARNGKASKGEFALQNSELNGVLITGSIGAVISIDMDNASNMNYNSIATPAVSQTKITTISNERVVAYNVYKEAVA